MSDTAANFDSIYCEYYPRIHRYVSRLIGVDDAEDVVQEVFLKVSKSLNDYRGDASLSTWVYRIATNAALDRIRTPAYRARLTAVPVDESCEAGEGTAAGGGQPLSAEDEVIRGEMSGCVQGILAQLPDSYRTALVLSEAEGMKDREIADVLGVTIETVKIRLHRARARLKQSLEANCSFYRDPRNTLLCDIKRQAN